ncbi:LuxR C-terminal-related transcriptional regulator [Paractinoplanes atraurantiacus]|uniref:LuxR family transcriptional regulator, maltose regulon positive regulatory protein n=1 Tax=Paractinoplanes atraurantiacus TaxID=1036182 RepID=A0A285JVK1_9ACTN|nr:LuxR family transcriptional regulator [Actinoplanes atraurantiacus]SNY64298.1 LuxR family transcriptional regulator, maltose regulon positive regulatory protein [Actinoplanes atraurantiacus]
MIPALPRALIRRPRLEAALDDGLSGAVTVVRAGAGWGKTVLVATWARRRPEPVAWVTLTEQHNDVGAFRSALEAALSTGARPAVLVLDDYQWVRDPCCVTHLETLIGSLHVILAGRGEPALPTHRLRVAGELTVIGAGALALTAAEAAELARAAGLPPPADGRLARTEGWPAGLRLEPDAVDGYLEGEVLADLPPPARRLLAYASVLSSVPPELAADLAGEPHAARILTDLVRADAFVAADPDDPQRFRYHPQLGDTLLRGLRRDEPETVRRLHRTAMRWYASRLFVYDALHHAAEAEDWPALGRLIVGAAAPLIVTVNRARLNAILSRVPWAAFETTAELAVCGALRLFADGDYAAVPAQLARAERMLAGRSPQDRLMTETAVRLLEATVVTRVRGEMPNLVAQTTRILRSLAAVRPEQMPSARHYRAIAIASKGVGLFWTDRADVAERYLFAGLSAARTAGVELVELNMLGHLAALTFHLGRMDEAERYAAQSRETAERRRLSSTQQAVLGYLVEAMIAMRRGDAAEAEKALTDALHLAPYPHEAALVTLSGLVRAQVLLVRDEPAAAREAIRHVRADWPTTLDAPLLAQWLDRTEADIDRAAHQPSPDGELSPREQEVLVFLPTMLTVGEIAGELTVSVNTVKAHIRAIYRKLNATRRREAVTAARDRGLLP